MFPLPTRRWLLWFVATAWMAAIVGGFAWLWDYAATPGETGSAPVRWPSDSLIVPAHDRPTLVMFAHPKCPCTQASIAELERTMTLCGDRVAVHVLFGKPVQADESWERTKLWKAAARIPGVRVAADAGLCEARRFAASVSGHVVLYDAEGSLLFHGGITAVRGHLGDNAGRAAVVAWVTTGHAEICQADAFGCALADAPRPPDQE